MGLSNSKSNNFNKLHIVTFNATSNISKGLNHDQTVMSMVNNNRKIAIPKNMPIDWYLIIKEIPRKIAQNMRFFGINCFSQYGYEPKHTKPDLGGWDTSNEFKKADVFVMNMTELESQFLNKSVTKIFKCQWTNSICWLLYRFYYWRLNKIY